jgi:hypothetical protein
LPEEKSVPESKCWAGSNLGTPAEYVIKVQGYLDDGWARQLGLSLSHSLSVDDVPLTILQGQLVDQAALFGVLNQLYGLGLPLLSVAASPVTTTKEGLAPTKRQKYANTSE